jgi:hypothetical protein
MTTEQKTRYGLFAVEGAIVVAYVVTLKWLIPHGGRWSGALLVLGLAMVAALIVQSRVLRTRLDKGKTERSI